MPILTVLMDFSGLVGGMFLEMATAHMSAALYNLLQNLKEHGKTLVIVTHDGKAMHGIVDEIAVLDKGSIVAQGSSTELAENENSLVRALVEGTER